MLEHADDTSLRLMQASLPLCENYWCEAKSIGFISNEISIKAHRVLEIKSRRMVDDFAFGPAATFRPRDFTHVLYRDDPPVDLPYIQRLQLFNAATGHGDQRGTEFINPAEIILTSTSKLEVSLIPGNRLRNVVSCDWREIKDFGMAMGSTVIKPMHGLRGLGVVRIHWRLDLLDVVESQVRAATHDFCQPIIVQELADAPCEELRVWFVDGLPVAAAIKKRSGNGAALEPPTPRALLECNASVVGQHLRSRGIRFVAVDFIGDAIVDVNFVSPGLIVEAELALGRDIATGVMAALIGQGREATASRLSCAKA
ncbi:hypothetical protein JY651_28825 [Pyxidicoccus parkwayensis]|uniref:ATP-grasp domain-containing protein n=1 Tax=Pyxidicoccus parkwayensis TaxID=2813578 RepID=A0ABX7NPL6_9BACT|nr:hypothetical protein [Pyxidicoccus parkwaysis]QSQ19336.1 hypothetical protein JY651_28825 [Pyxidicoccus parkwaysis]